MASKPPLPLADRTDVHKACKSLETLINVLNDYCEAAGIIASLQKKLAKAMRETAAIKTTSDIPANAFNASAAIFEVSSDIDAKFAKFADKEYNMISAEVKKWFKKLAKEEKTHDERMANANARIKQAGQVYEKKSKRNPRDAAEEHSRYINLISQLGPEISQEKYNHTLDVTQRHVATTYSAAACLSRIADAEWLKTCEGVRRYSSAVGQLGEWRSLCEGGWSGPVPPDLLDLDDGQRLQRNREAEIEEKHDADVPNNLGDIIPQRLNVPSPAGSSSVARTEEHLPRQSPTSAKAQIPFHFAQNSSTAAPSVPLAGKNNNDSVRSLSAFPLPPAHFPIPPLRQSQSSQSSSHHSVPLLVDSPLPESAEDDRDIEDERAETSIPVVTPAPPTTSFPEQASQSRDKLHVDAPLQQDNRVKQPTSFRSQTLQSLDTSLDPGSQSSQHNSFNDEREFGVITDRIPGNSVHASPERNDRDGSRGSIVAEMRNRYNNAPNNSPPMVREAPHIPINVNDIARRHQPTDVPSSPRLRTPSVPRQIPLPPDPNKGHQGDSYTDTSALGRPPVSSSPTSPRIDESARRRQQRLNDLAQLEVKEKELASEQREKELERKARELERDRTRLNDVQEGNEYETLVNHDMTAQVYPQLRPRERKTSFRTQRPESQFDSDNGLVAYSQNSPKPYSQHSYSTSNLLPPTGPSTSTRPSPNSHDWRTQHSSGQYSHSPTLSQQSLQSSVSPEHAPNCGCESCSISKYRAPPSPSTALSPRSSEQHTNLHSTEKSKPGWIRRLSMPVGAAFSLDSSKKNKGIGNNLAGIAGGQSRPGTFSMDGRRNASSTALHVPEGGRRSYDANGIGSRSRTDLVSNRR